MNFDELTSRYAGTSTASVISIDTAGRRTAVSHAELAVLVSQRVDALRAAGVLPGHVIGIRARNSIDWVIWDLAAVEIGAVLQAFPDELQLSTVSTVDSVLAEHGLALLVADGMEAAGHLSALAPDERVAGHAVAASARRVEIDGLHSMVYSSGTSGKLKGLRISRKGTEYVIGRFMACFPVGRGDSHLIFLPLANYQQRLSVYCCLWTGADIVFAPYQRVFAAIKAERPTFLIGPPVFYDTLLQLFSKTGGGQPLSEFLGGRMHFMITGMAPIRRSTVDAFRAAGVELLEAYGMTESGMIAWNTLPEHRSGSVGKLIDPEMVEFQPDGELIIRRPHPLSLGYFEADADVAQETFRPDGTIATGDIGALDADGFLTLVGRKKDAIPLGSGRKVHPAEIEAVLAAIEGVAEVVVVSTPELNRLGALVLPAVPGDELVRQRIREGVAAANRRLESYQRIASVVFTKQPLQSDPRFMTKNMKLSRPAATAYFAERCAPTGQSVRTGAVDN